MGAYLLLFLVFLVKGQLRNKTIIRDDISMKNEIFLHLFLFIMINLVYL